MLCYGGMGQGTSEAYVTGEQRAFPLYVPSPRIVTVVAATDDESPPPCPLEAGG